MFGPAPFRTGARQLFLPDATVTLCRARLPPHRALFKIPLSFSKLDLRDYLWHLYGLKTTRIAVALTPHRWRTSFRSGTALKERRSTQKRAIVDMAEPFVFPDVPIDLTDYAVYEYRKELFNSRLRMQEAFKDVIKEKPNWPLIQNQPKQIGQRRLALREQGIVSEEKTWARRLRRVLKPHMGQGV